MPQIILPVAIGIGASLIGGLLKPKQKFFADDRPTTLTLRGSYVPLLFGRRRVGPVFGWAGNRSVVSNGGQGKNFGSGGGSNTYYESGWHILAIGAGAELTSIYQDGRVIFKGPITPSDTPSGSHLTMLNGEGDAYIYWGEFDQNINTYLADATRVGVASQWPNLFYIVWNQKNLGSSPRWGNLEYEIVVKVQNSPLTASSPWISVSQAYAGGETIDSHGNIGIQTFPLVDGVNPAHALWQLFTAVFPHGMGLDPSLLDGGAFEALGGLLSSENAAMNSIASDGMSCADFAGQIMTDFGIVIDQVGNALVPFAVRSGASSACTITQDAAVPPLPERIQTYDDKTPSRLVFSYKGRQNFYRDASIRLDDDSLALRRHQPATQTIQMPSVIDPFTAAAIAHRRQPEFVTSAETYRINVDRGATQLCPGQVFTYEDIGLLRVVSNQMMPSGNGAVIEAVLDQYSGVPGTDISAPAPVGGTGGNFGLAPDVAVVATVVPSSIAATVAICVARVRANAGIAGALVWISVDGTTYVKIGSQDQWSAGGILNSPIGADDASPIDVGPTITPYNNDIQNVQDLSGNTAAWQAGLQLAFIDQEIFFLQRVTAVPGGWALEGMIRARYSGPQAHAFTAPVVISNYSTLVQLKSPLLVQGATIYIKTQPYNASGFVDITTVTPVTLTIPHYAYPLIGGGQSGIAGELIPSDCIVEDIDGVFMLADVATSQGNRVRGICTAQTASGLKVNAQNRLQVTGLSGLTPRATYYLGSAGRFTLTPPTSGLFLPVGVADSATSMWFELGEPIRR